MRNAKQMMGYDGGVEEETMKKMRERKRRRRKKRMKRGWGVEGERTLQKGRWKKKKGKEQELEGRIGISLQFRRFFLIQARSRIKREKDKNNNRKKKKTTASSFFLPLKCHILTIKKTLKHHKLVIVH